MEDVSTAYGICDSEFILLIGRAFLQELSLGKRDEAIAFGRALLALMLA